MKLEKKTANGIAEKCAIELISSLGADNISQIPYDVVLSEMAEMMEDIEDKMDIIVNRQMEKTMTAIKNIDDLWEE